MIVFYDPNNQNQVMALYSGDTTSRVWADRGYLKAEVALNLEATISRNHRCTVRDGTVTAISGHTNSSQPTIDARTLQIRALNAKLQADTITDAEVRELLKLERSPA